jgi:uncharacterized protein YjiS (DUF1127 family)
MTAPLAKEQLKLLSPINLTYGDAPVQASHGIGLFRLVVDAVRWVVTWPRRQAVLDELSRLTDRELNDIGLNRGEIRAVFSRPR